jgi:hypothetical protein
MEYTFLVFSVKKNPEGFLGVFRAACGGGGGRREKVERKKDYPSPGEGRG